VNFAEFVKQECPQLEPAKPFDTDYWSEEIRAAMSLAATEDQGSLSWCRQNRSDIYQRCTKALRKMNDAFASKDALATREAIRVFVVVHRESVSAMRRAASA